LRKRGEKEAVDCLVLINLAKDEETLTKHDFLELQLG
jgi:hypothetical protein